MIIKLSNFLRHSLNSDPVDGISLKDEIDALKLYLRIEEARFGDRLSINININKGAEKVQVPGMILQPLVENSIKYAIAPNEKGGEITINATIKKNMLDLHVLDSGPGFDKNLIDFAFMGSALFNSLYPKEKAKVALLNIGSEEIKGTEILKTTYLKLKRLSNDDNFIFNGYIEGNQLMEGDSNVIVTDGFTGNVALKTAEGTAKFITTSLKEALTKSLLSKISILFSYFELKKFKAKLDPSKYNGAIFLGLNGPVVKSHGSIDAKGFYYSIDLCYKIIKGNLMHQIKNNLQHLDGEN